MRGGVEVQSTEDYKLWLKYYSKIDDNPNDIDVIIDDLN